MDDFLKHHGVKGMKWGVRKDVAGGVSSAAREAANASERLSRSTKSSKRVSKEVSKMSDQELRERINRMEMERKYSELNPSKVSRGASRAADVLSAIGSVAAVAASVATVALAVQNYRANSGTSSKSKKKN